jgi:hypothetical protein
MTTTHTPGPWFASGTDVKPLGNRPIICWTGTPERALPEARANARLVAAAPALLAALQAILAKHDDRDGMSDMWPREAALARAAIAAAKGE